MKATLPAGVRRFDQCRIPLAVSAFDAFRLKTRTLEEGCLAQALRATCTFPVLFAPVWHEKGVLVDGGVRDTTGAFYFTPMQPFWFVFSLVLGLGLPLTWREFLLNETFSPRRRRLLVSILFRRTRVARIPKCVCGGRWFHQRW